MNAVLLDAIDELTKMNFRVVFYPFGEGIACTINKYGENDRTLTGVITKEKMPEAVQRIAERIKSGEVPDEWWQGPRGGLSHPVEVPIEKRICQHCEWDFEINYPYDLPLMCPVCDEEVEPNEPPTRCGIGVTHG